MSFKNAIEVDSLCKCYQIYDRPKDRLLQMLYRGRRKYYREFWALNKVSFAVRKGETVGIIGRNGSGKSTLLQLICGTLNPTSGTIHTNGRIAALLELGSGFNPEFTGRENVYLNASVLGLSHAEIDERFHQIAAFADIGSFIEQPVKMYSSGMMIRLAFAVAINVEPEILIVDEALSVGDELFQRKCFSKIESIRENGATILFVSHSGTTIINLCDRAILLDSGEKIIQGSPKKVVSYYQKLIYAPAEKQKEIREQLRALNIQDSSNKQSIDVDEASISASQQKDQEERHAARDSFDKNLIPSSTVSYESRGALISNPKIISESGHEVNVISRGCWYTYTYQVDFTQEATNARFGMLIKTITGVELGGGVTEKKLSDTIPFVMAGQTYNVSFRFHCRLNSGVFFLNAGVLGYINEEEKFLHRLLDGAMFKVQDEESGYYTGIVDFACEPFVEIV